MGGNDLRLTLEFQLQANRVQVEYRKVFMHFLKACIDDANDGKYYEDFYGSCKAKNFTFSIFFDEPCFKGEFIELGSNRVKMLFSVADQMQGYIFYSSFLEKRHKKIILADDNYMTLEKVMKIAEPEVHNDKMIIKMNSPLLVRKHDRSTNYDQYLYYEQEEFEKEVAKNLRYQLQEEGFEEGYINNVRILPIKCRKVVVKHYGCKFAGSLGNFLIEGDPIILNYLLQAGIMGRRSEGFGMAELLTDEL